MEKITLFSILLLILLSLTTNNVNARRDRMVGARTEIKDVQSNKEVQKIGKFSVEQYNREILDMPPSPLRGGVGLGERTTPLEFVKVVEAQRQVVSGIKYYLKVEAEQGGVTRTFDAVVVVQPWVQSKKLLNFGPAPRSTLPKPPSERM